MLLCNDVSHWLSANLESDLSVVVCCYPSPLGSVDISPFSPAFVSNLLVTPNSTADKYHKLVNQGNKDTIYNLSFSVYTCQPKFFVVLFIVDVSHWLGASPESALYHHRHAGL